ncbi:MAG: YMGG-like glycine zipper-containing protein [Pseudomonadota bacterium]
MMRFGILAACGAMAVSACTASGTAERGAVGGALAGAAAGAVLGQVISGRPGQGAAAGAALGALGGATLGCTQAKDCFGRAQQANDRRFDRYAERYYYVDPQTGDSYWENGDFRAYGPGRGR